MMMKVYRVAITSLMLLSTACTPRMGEDDVVTIDNKVFDRDDFFGEVVESRFASMNDSARKEMVGDFAHRRIVMMEAKKRGLLKDKETLKGEHRTRENLVVSKILEEEVWSSVLSDSSLRVLYDRIGREISVHHIVLTYEGSNRSVSDRSEEEAQHLIGEIREKIVGGEMKFHEGAKRFSEDPSRSNHGLLGRFKWGKLFEPVQSVAFSMGGGEISQPFKSDVGYHIVRVTGVKRLSLPPYEEMIPQLRKFIRSVRGHEFDLALRDFESRLQRRYGVTFNEETIGRLLKEIARVHGEKEGAPRASEIVNAELRGIICVAGSVPVELPWFQERIEILGSPISESMIISERSLTVTLEHILFRFLTTQYAEETKEKEWHAEVEQAVKRKWPDILKGVLTERLSQENPDVPKDELIQLVTDRYRVRVNEVFLSSFSDSAKTV